MTEAVLPFVARLTLGDQVYWTNSKSELAECLAAGWQRSHYASAEDEEWRRARLERCRKDQVARRLAREAAEAEAERLEDPLTARQKQIRTELSRMPLAFVIQIARANREILARYATWWEPSRDEVRKLCAEPLDRAIAAESELARRRRA